MKFENEVLEKLILVDEVKEAYKLSQSGASYKQIGEKMNVSEKKARKLIATANYALSLFERGDIAEKILTQKEYEVYVHRMKGLSIKEIASVMGVTSGAVSEHYRSMFRRFRTYDKSNRKRGQSKEYVEWASEKPTNRINIRLEKIKSSFTICKVSDYSFVNLEADFCFISKTDNEKSLVCLTEDVPTNVIERDDGWRAFRIVGELDFSVVGILSKISGILACFQIPLFAMSTYNTDYILMKDEYYEKALSVLDAHGYYLIDKVFDDMDDE